MDGAGSLVDKEIIPTYIEEIAKGFELARPVRVVVDAGTGQGPWWRSNFWRPSVRK